MMTDTKKYASDVAFTGTVKAIQARKGSRMGYARMEAGGSWQQSISAELKAEIEADLPFRNPPIRLDGRSRIALHRDGSVLHGEHRGIVYRGFQRFQVSFHKDSGSGASADNGDAPNI